MEIEEKLLKWINERMMIFTSPKKWFAQTQRPCLMREMLAPQFKKASSGWLQKLTKRHHHSCRLISFVVFIYITGNLYGF